MRTNQAVGLDLVFGPSGITASGADTLYDTANTFDYCINGKVYNKATVASGSTPTSDAEGNAFDAIGADQAAAFLWMVNASGTVGVMQGPVVDIDGETNDFKEDGGRPEFPSVPDGWVPFAYMLLQVDGTGSAWTLGASNWNATGVTKALVDVSVLPDRPQADARS